MVYLSQTQNVSKLPPPRRPSRPTLVPPFGLAAGNDAVFRFPNAVRTLFQAVEFVRLGGRARRRRRFPLFFHHQLPQLRPTSTAYRFLILLHYDVVRGSFVFEKQGLVFGTGGKAGIEGFTNYRNGANVGSMDASVAMAATPTTATTTTVSLGFGCWVLPWRKKVWTNTNTSAQHRRNRRERVCAF